MYRKPTIVAMDLEGVLVPEVWIAVSEKTGIEKLRLTTRDVSDYDQLMRMRLSILEERELRLRDIQEVISTMDPLPGAIEFLDWLREEAEPVILSDTFYEFAHPLMKKLVFPRCSATPSKPTAETLSRTTISGFATESEGRLKLSRRSPSG